MNLLINLVLANLKAEIILTPYIHYNLKVFVSPLLLASFDPSHTTLEWQNDKFQKSIY